MKKLMKRLTGVINPSLLWVVLGGEGDRIAQIRSDQILQRRIQIWSFVSSRTISFTKFRSFIDC